MYLSAIAAISATGNLATYSQYFLVSGIGLILLMGLIYLWYTLGSARLARQVEAIQVAAKNTSSKRTQQARASVATLEKSEVILHEQPDGEEPIALNRGLLIIGRIGTLLGWLAVAALVLGLALRAEVEQHAPWSNLYEFSMSFTTALLFCYLIFEARYHERVRAWGLYVCTLALIITQELIPALQDKTILTIHVGVAILAYSLFCVAFGAGLIMLIQDGEGQRYKWLPSAEAADSLSYKAVIAAFPLLALTLILGAYWANYAWGHYWSWDPKETSALVTWLIYAVYLHARGIRGWRGKRLAWLLALGFAATLFTYYGVSFFVPGLHSYAYPK
jgi:cytochrome c-type biogenesis protein CcsB